MKVTKEFTNRIKTLKFKYSDQPAFGVLVAIPTEDSKENQTINIEYKEFTSLCPLNVSQPDYATVLLEYCPKIKYVELKSLKFYLTSFRTVEIFHEEAPKIVGNHLVDLLDPYFLDITFKWSIRGGLLTTTNWTYYQEKLPDLKPYRSVSKKVVL